jgi:hypothetical protein
MYKNGHKMDQIAIKLSIEMVIKHIKIFHSKGFQNVKKLGVWFENKPSGNP